MGAGLPGSCRGEAVAGLVRAAPDLPPYSSPCHRSTPWTPKAASYHFAEGKSGSHLLPKSRRRSAWPGYEDPRWKRGGSPPQSLTSSFRGRCFPGEVQGVQENRSYLWKVPRRQTKLLLLLPLLFPHYRGRRVRGGKNLLLEIPVEE